MRSGHRSASRRNSSLASNKPACILDDISKRTNQQVLSIHHIRNTNSPIQQQVTILPTFVIPNDALFDKRATNNCDAVLPLSSILPSNNSYQSASMSTQAPTKTFFSTPIRLASKRSSNQPSPSPSTTIHEVNVLQKLKADFAAAVHSTPNNSSSSLNPPRNCLVHQFYNTTRTRQQLDAILKTPKSAQHKHQSQQSSPVSTKTSVDISFESLPHNYRMTTCPNSPIGSPSTSSKGFYGLKSHIKNRLPFQKLVKASKNSRFTGKLLPLVQDELATQSSNHSMNPPFTRYKDIIYPTKMADYAHQDLTYADDMVITTTETPTTKKTILNHKCDDLNHHSSANSQLQSRDSQSLPNHSYPSSTSSSIASRKVRQRGLPVIRSQYERRRRDKAEDWPLESWSAMSEESNKSSN